MSETTFGPPPVEPMSDLAWARVERGLWAQLDGAPQPKPARARSMRWVWFAVPAAAMAVLAVIALRGASDRPRQIPDDTLSRVATGAAASSIAFGDSHIELDANSAVIMNREGPMVILENGAAWFTVAPRDGRPPFVVVAGDTMVRVVGTRFRVARDGEHASVRVDHGVVQVRFRGTQVEIGANQEWSSDHPSEVVRTAIEPALPPATATAAPTESDTARSNPPATTITPAASCDRDCKQFRRLEAIERRDPAAAVAGYLELSSKNGPWAENALFAACRLTADLHDARARMLLPLYLKRFPSGAHAVDVRQLLVLIKGETP